MTATATPANPQTSAVPALKGHSGPAVIEATILIERPVADVWSAIADYSFDLQWREGLREMTPDPAGPPREGTRTREVLRSVGLSFTTDSIVSDVDWGTSYRFAGSGTIGEVSGMRRVEPGPRAGTAIFTYEVHLSPKPPLRPLRRIIASALRAGLQKDLGRLKALMETA